MRFTSEHCTNYSVKLLHHPMSVRCASKVTVPSTWHLGINYYTHYSAFNTLGKHLHIINDIL